MGQLKSRGRAAKKQGAAEGTKAAAADEQDSGTAEEPEEQRNAKERRETQRGSEKQQNVREVAEGAAEKWLKGGCRGAARGQRQRAAGEGQQRSIRGAPELAEKRQGPGEQRQRSFRGAA